MMICSQAVLSLDINNVDVGLLVWEIILKMLTNFWEHETQLAFHCYGVLLGPTFWA